MTEQPEKTAPEGPHAPTEADAPTETSHSANQYVTAPAPPSPAHGESESSETDEDTSATHGGAPGGMDEEQDQVGAPQRTVPDVPPAQGTSEAMRPVQGVHTPDVGPGGDDVDTARRPMPGRTTQSADEP